MNKRTSRKARERRKPKDKSDLEFSDQDRSDLLAALSFYDLSLHKLMRSLRESSEIRQSAKERSDRIEILITRIRSTLI